ncbi:MAG: hypothetical protein ACLVJ6_01615 [Merdibacter sp.]
MLSAALSTFYFIFILRLMDKVVGIATFPTPQKPFAQRVRADETGLARGTRLRSAFSPLSIDGR